MPRQPDPHLQERILNAAQKLWKKGADETLTMRAVAQAAGTNTPAVYRRFRNREDILRALLRRIQQDVVAALQPCSCAEEACERYVEFAVSHRSRVRTLLHPRLRTIGSGPVGPCFSAAGAPAYHAIHGEQIGRAAGRDGRGPHPPIAGSVDDGARNGHAADFESHPGGACSGTAFRVRGCGGDSDHQLVEFVSPELIDLARCAQFLVQDFAQKNSLFLRKI